MATKYVSTTKLQYFKNKLDSIFAKKTDLPTIDNSLSSTSTNPVQNKVVYTEIESLKKSVSDGKTALASAITEKGVSTASNATFDTMASNISNIKTESVLTGDAIAGNVLSGKTFYNTDAKNKITGTMTNRGAVSANVAVDGRYTIPAGYHNGSGKVTGPTLSGNATAADVASGKTFYSNSGTKLTGTMVKNKKVYLLQNGAFKVSPSANNMLWHNGNLCINKPSGANTCRWTNLGSNIKIFYIEVYKANQDGTMTLGTDYNSTTFTSTYGQGTANLSKLVCGKTTLSITGDTYNQYDNRYSFQIKSVYYLEVAN